MTLCAQPAGSAFRGDHRIGYSCIGTARSAGECWGEGGRQLDGLGDVPGDGGGADPEGSTPCPREGDLRGLPLQPELRLRRGQDAQQALSALLLALPSCQPLPDLCELPAQGPAGRA